MKPDEVMELLREAHREPIPEAYFAAVRARVLSKIASERAISRRRVWWCGFAIVAAAALLLTFRPKQPVSSHVASEARSPVVKPLATAPSSVSNPKRDRPVVAARPRPRRKPAVTGVIGPPNPAPLVVKMLTDDPKVVIYWISTGTGE
jgi:hypothetical protein